MTNSALTRIHARTNRTCIAEHCDKGVSHTHLPEDEGLGKYIAAGYCFTCSYWQERADHDRADRRAFVVQKGDEMWHYVAGTRKGGHPKGRGSYGEHFRIELTDADGIVSRIGTEDLWAQGAIPPEWQHLFDRVPRGRFM